MVYTKKNNNTIRKKSFKNYSSSNRKNSKQSIKSRSPLSLTGGFSNDVMNNNLFVRNPNLHNTNPQASLDLDKQFMSSSGISASGSNNLYSGLQQGGSTCGNKGVDKKMLKSDTFKNYLNKLKKKLDFPLKNATMSSGGGVKQKAGGFTTDPSEFIAGRPVIKGYDDCCPPALINGTLKFGGSDTSVCGAGATRGGGHHNNNIIKKNKNKQQKQYRQFSNKKKQNKKNSKKQRGGYFSAFAQSKPAEYESAFNGPKSVFTHPDNMSTRVFDERQPNYSVNAI